ncbi:MAG TPA: neutral/alkaline non-lysosomal ceramidase N-terminal domain-containing protein [Terracidiphilus sp.]|nr:neutral/alkaline non-lysosomal ceramidase N-terminal domain-containing protein [Terracidiphilus sp.]
MFPAALVFLLTVAFLQAGDAAEMKAGVAKVEITPPLGTLMWGYFDRLTGAVGVLDPLYARVLVLESGNTRLAYVDLDLGRTFGPASLESLRNAAKHNSGIDDLIVQATHTHTGPVILDEYPNGPPAWETEDLNRIEHAIHDAIEHAVPVRIGVGYSAAYIGYNRRRVNADGSVSMLWSNATQAPTYPVDPLVAVLRIDRIDGEPLAILVNYAAHPVTFGSDALRFSADFPGVMCKVVEQAFGGKPLAFFAQGAAGDINVFDAGTPINLDAIGRRDWAGDTLGKAAVSAAQQIQTTVDPAPKIDFDDESVAFKLRWDPDKFKQETMRELGPKAFDVFASPIKETMALPVTTALINRKIAIVGMPGEPFVDFQTELRAKCPVNDCFFLGYTNGYYGYLPTIKAASEGGYGAVSATTWVQVGAGEEMEDFALFQIDRMLGRFEDTPNANWNNLPPAP